MSPGVIISELLQRTGQTFRVLSESRFPIVTTFQKGKAFPVRHFAPACRP
jgi:hypothetical protein